MTPQRQGPQVGRTRLWLLLLVGCLAFLLPCPRVGAEDGATVRPQELDRLWQETGRLYAAGMYGEAIPFAAKAIQLSEKALGPIHPDTATSLNNLAFLYHATGDYAKAEPLFRRALEIKEKTLGSTHPGTATSLNNLAALFYTTGDYAKAEPLYDRALEIREKTLGPTHPDTATSLNNLAELYRAMGDYAQTEPLLRRALEVAETVLGPTHPDTASSLNNLALLYHATGDYAEAEPLLRRALEIHEKALGPTHPGTATSLNNLAGFYGTTGDYAKAEVLYRRALEIYEEALGPTHPDTARSLNNLALLHHATGDYARADPLLRRALEIREKALGPTHPDTATSLNNLAELYRTTGDYARADPLYGRAMKIYEKALGPTHPGTAASLNNLAALYRATGDYAKAEPLYRRALEIREKALGPTHPETAGSLNNLGFVLFDLERRTAALVLARRAQESVGATLANVLSFTSETQRLAYQATLNPYTLLATLGDASGVALSILRFKGVVLDSLLEDRLVAEASENPEHRARIDELRSAKQQLFQLTLEVPTDLRPEALERRDARRKELSAQVERLEAALARQVAGLGRPRRALGVEVNEVQAALPQGTVLAEVIRYQHYLGKNRGETRYGVAVLGPSGEPAWVSLGEAAGIDAAVSRYQTAIRTGSQDREMREILRELSERVWAPLEPALPPGTRTVVLSPDGALNRVSFATLLTAQGEFLGSRYSIRYVASGRDLLRELPPQAPAQLVVYANPDFSGKDAGSPKTPGGAAVALRGLERSDLAGVHLGPLPGTARESAGLAQEAAQWKWAVERHEGARATETQLRDVRSPRVLHLATHGFFLSEAEEAKPGQGTRGVAVVAKASLFGSAEAGALHSPPVVLRNPMHRSGLALVGAQRTLEAWRRGETPPTASDGIVTAEEVGGLKLSGTWLVTLSACDTGVGEERSGEGVLGLRRGFIQAGAQNLLMTLWPVADEETVGLMLEFYRAAQRSGNAPEALAEVQRRWLERLNQERGLVAAVKLAGPFLMSFQGPVR